MRTVVKNVTARDFLPKQKSLTALQSAAKGCQGCHLYQQAKQTVFGMGAKQAELMMVGEIPGEKENEMGLPFVGPAGMLLRKTLEKCEVPINEVYLTNVVKHFKFIMVNHRKLHRSPNGAEIKACKPWLEAEIEVVKPRIILCLGLVAAKTLVHRNVQIYKDRGKWYPIREETMAFITFHPSAILRAVDAKARREMLGLFEEDIGRVREALVNGARK